MPSVETLIDSEVAGVPEAVRVRGRELEAVVQLVRFAPQVVTAEVDDAATHVEFTVVEGVLRWFCTCPEGRAGAFCVHCVATALATRRRVPARGGVT